MNLKPGERFRVRVQVNGKEIPVELRADYCPETDAEETIASYNVKVLELRYEIEKLQHVCRLAAHFETQIRWNVFDRLRALDVG